MQGSEAGRAGGRLSLGLFPASCGFAHAGSLLISLKSVVQFANQRVFSFPPPGATQLLTGLAAAVSVFELLPEK